MHTVEHITYKGGGKQEDETAFHTFEDAHEFALDMLQRHGGRVWINGHEITRKELGQCVHDTIPNT